MKKFLTVLLALSVVFTYSFSAVGSAFAATDTEVADASTYADNVIAAVANSYKADLLAAKTYDKTAIENATTDALTIGRQLTADLITKNDDATTGFDKTQFEADINAWATKDENATGLNETKVAYAKTTYKAYFDSVIKKYDLAEKKAAAIAEVNAVQSSDYTDQLTIKINGTDYTHQQAAAIYCKDALAALDELTEANYDSASTGIGAILYGQNGTKDNLTGGLFKSLDDLFTNAEYAELQGNQIIDVDHAIANITYFAKRTYYDNKKAVAGSPVSVDADGKYYGVKPASAAKVTADEAAKMNANLMAGIDSYLAAAKIWFNELPASGKTPEALTTVVNYVETGDNLTGLITLSEAADDFYAAVEKRAAELKDAVNFAGEKKFADADVDAALADAKTEIYSKFDTNGYSKDISTYFSKLVAIDDPVAVAIKAAIEKWQPAIKYTGEDKTAEEDKKYCKNYYAAGWQGAYDDIAAATIAKLKEDPKTIEEVNAIMADADADLAELRTAENDTQALADAIAKAKVSLWQYAHERLTLLNGKDWNKDGDYRVKSFNDDVDSNDITSAYEAGCDLLDEVLSEAAVSSAYEEAKALFKDIKTDKVLKEEAAKVQSTIAALPATVKLADEEKFMAAKDAYEAYLANYGAKKADIPGAIIFDQKMSTLNDLQADAFNTAVAAIDDDKVISKEEVEAARAMFDKYYNFYDQYGEAFKADDTELIKLEKQVRSDEITAVEHMMAKLNYNSSIEELNAAKAAYDALTGGQQREVAKAYPYKLQLLNERLVEAVESLKITTSTKLYKGSKIRVKWTVKGDASVADGYQVYKSTKAQKNYKFMGKTKKSYMDNKKNLKKGTRYFYKVRAYKVVDGVKYYSDWSNKGNRIYKK